MSTSEIEVWKDIPDYTNYQASSLGRIRQLLSSRDYKYLKPSMTTDGYLTVCVVNCPLRYPTVAKLVCLAFHGYPSPDIVHPVTDHINNISTDNRPENLRWISQKDNVNQAIKYRIGKCRIQCVETGQIYESISDASKQLNIRYYSIYNNIRNNLPTHGLTFERIIEDK